MTIQIVPTYGPKARITAKKAASSYCQVPSASIWFPTQTGVTTLPPAPSVIVNANPKPINAATLPTDWAEADLCRLFQDILPVSADPVYDEALDVGYVFKPYQEVIAAAGAVRLSVSVKSYNYALVLGPFDVELPVTIASEFSTVPVRETFAIRTIIEVSSTLIPYQSRTLTVRAAISGQNLGIAADPYYLLHMDGLDGSTQFIDQMGNTTWTSRFASLTSSKEKLGISVGDFTIATSQITATSTVIDLSTNNFVLDFWFYSFTPSNDFVGRYLFSSGDSGANSSRPDYGIYMVGNSAYFAYKPLADSLFTSSIAVANSIQYNQWNHLFVSRIGNYIYYSFNFGTTTSALMSGTAPICGTTTHIFGNSSKNDYFTGYIDEVRFIPGIGFSINGPETTQPYDPQPPFRVARLRVRTRILAEFFYVNRVTVLSIAVRPSILSTTGYGFKPAYYTGNSASSRTFSSIGFRPGLAIFKTRNYSGNQTYVFDVTRTIGYSISLDSYSSIENFYSNSVTSFGQDSITVGSSSYVNSSSNSYSAWIFKGAETNYITTSRTEVSDGYLAQNTVNVNKKEGISYGKYYTNDTNSESQPSSYRTWVYHGLGGEPDFMIFMPTNSGQTWTVSKLFPQNGYLSWRESNQVAINADNRLLYKYSATRPDYMGISSILDNQTNRVYSFIAFKNTEGYVKHDQYLGNATTPIFIETGFKPAFILLRLMYGDTNLSGKGIVIYDAARGFDYEIKPIEYNAETYTGTKVTVSSNGFTIQPNTDLSKAGSVYLYLAVAGTLVSPLTKTFTVVSPPSASISVQASAVSVLVQVELDVPAAAIVVAASPVDKVTTAPYMLVPATLIQVAAGQANAFANVRLNVGSSSISVNANNPIVNITVNVYPAASIITVSANNVQVGLSPSVVVPASLITVSVNPITYSVKADLVGGPGSYVITGYDTTGGRSVTLVAAAGSLQITGESSLGINAYNLNAAVGSFSANGQDAELVVDTAEAIYFSDWAEQVYSYESGLLPDWWAD